MKLLSVRHIQRCIQNAEKVSHIKGRLLDQAMIIFNCIPFQMGTSLKGKNSLPEGANSFLYEQYLIVWKFTFITLSDLPLMLLFLSHMCVYCVMGATPMIFLPFPPNIISKTTSIDRFTMVNLQFRNILYTIQDPNR